ncbi:MAG: serine/threonine-protein phosphatase [Clostridia bacterium]
MKFSVYLHTDVGTRSCNEDCAGYRVKPLRGSVFAVADGLGGHDAGEVASRCACEFIIDAFTRTPTLKAGEIQAIFKRINEAVMSKQGGETGFYNMKTTLAAMLYRRNRVSFARVGDSRVYLFRKNHVIFQTLDHSIPQLAVLQGRIAPSEIRGHIDRNQLTRALGSPVSGASVSGKPLRVRRGDAVLLCTDGFWENVREECMEDTLSISKTPEQWVKLMLHQHDRASGERRDNNTAVAVFMR